jgi:HAE1 family hydrophobic/amphiphilic exporter-1
VAGVDIFGERKYSMRLWLDPVRMAGRGLTAPDVVSALSEQNVEVAAGQVGQQPAISGQQYQVSVRAVGRLSESAQFDNIILKTNADGTLVRLKDVGRAELGAEDYASDLQFNGQDAVGIGVTQLSGPLPNSNAYRKAFRRGCITSSRSILPTQWANPSEMCCLRWVRRSCWSFW